MDIPQDILDLVNSFKTRHLNFARDKKDRARQAKKQADQLKALRLKANLANARVVFEWVEVLYNSTVGKILMQESHPPTTYKNIFFFDGRVQDKDWVGFLIEQIARRNPAVYGGLAAPLVFDIGFDNSQRSTAGRTNEESA